MKRFLYLTGFMATLSTAWAAPRPDAHDHAHELPAAKAQLSFIENKGQWTSEAKYKAAIPGGAMFLTSQGFVYNYTNQADLDRIHELTCGPNAKKGVDISNDIVRQYAYKVNFVGALENQKFVTENKRTAYHNYFLGNDKSKWAGNVGLFGTVFQKEVYAGIDLKVYANSDNSVKYDFIVAPNANPASIKLQFEGVNPVISKKGAIILKTSFNEIVEEAPYSYQIINGKEVEVKSKYTLERNTISFSFPNGYNTNYPLIIDPSLVFATYSGGNQGNNYSYTTTYDAQGNLYAGGDAWNTGWPVTVGAFQTTYGGGSHEVAINKYSSNGTALIYSTYWGGSSWDLPHAMKVNSLGELVVVGSTSSTNAPTTTGCYDNTLGGSWDMFVAHFNANATALIGSTLIGGSGIEPQQFTMTGAELVSSNNGPVSSPVELTFDNANNIWVVGNTTSTDFPTTPGAQQSTFGGGIDGVIFKFNPTLSTLMYSSYLGGSGNDAPTSIDFNKDKTKLIVSGITSSSNFPVTSGSLFTTFQGGTFDGTITTINPTNGSIINSSYLGTSSNDHAVNIQIDCSDNIYVLGRTLGNYPITPGAWNRPNGDVFVDKLTPDLSASLQSTRLGNNQSGGRYFPSAFLVDICGNVYIGGFYAQSGLPLTPDAFQTNSVSFWFCTILSDFSDLKYASYFGQTTNDHNHIGVNRLDPNGFFYHSICSFTPFTQTTPNSYCPNKLASGQDVLSFKFNFDAINIGMDKITGGGGNDTNAHAIRGCKSAFVKFRREGLISDTAIIHYNMLGTANPPGSAVPDYSITPGPAGQVVFLPGESQKTIEIKPLLVPGMPTGPRTVIIQALNPCGCSGSQSIIMADTLTIYDSLYVTINNPLPAYCPGATATITADIDPTLNFSWTPAMYNQGSLTITPALLTTRDFTITVTQPGAPATCPPNSKTFHALVEQFPVIQMSSDTTVCVPDTIPIPVLVMPDSVHYIYKWTPATGLRADNLATNFFYRPVGVYNYLFNATTPIARCSSSQNITIRVIPPFKLTNVLPPSGTMVNYGSEVNMSAQGAVQYTWLPIGTFYDPMLQYATTLPVYEPKTFSVAGVDKYGCTDTAKIFIDVKYPQDPVMPNAFSPNSDNKNDVFGLTNAKFQKLLRFEVYNRYGQLIFSTMDPLKGWDGTYKGKICDQGVYNYIIVVELPNKTQKMYKGDVTLIK